jgi:hypothetical protein
VAAVVWLTFGDTLPGGRWFAVHLFTLGVLSNLVVVLSDHFGRTLLGAGPDRRVRRFVAFNVGALLVLGFPPELRYPLALGAAITSVTVVWLAIDLHRLRRRATDRKFVFVADGYQLACAAFLVGALLGALLGTRLLSGAWYGGARLAHLYVNVLGWGGLTLLTTVVFLAPRMMRTEPVRGAETQARHALRLAGVGLAVAASGLLWTGARPGADWPRSVAAVGLAFYAAAATAVCWQVLRSGRGAERSVHADMVRFACTWFVLVTWANAAMMATGRLRILDPLGAGLIVAVLGQSILATLNHLSPTVWGRKAGDRAQIAARLDRFRLTRVVMLNLGAALVVGAGLAGRGAGTAGSVAIRAGWALVTAAILLHVGLIVWHASASGLVQRGHRRAAGSTRAG